MDELCNQQRDDLDDYLNGKKDDPEFQAAFEDAIANHLYLTTKVAESESNEHYS